MGERGLGGEDERGVAAGGGDGHVAAVDAPDPAAARLGAEAVT